MPSYRKGKPSSPALARHAGRALRVASAALLLVSTQALAQNCPPGQWLAEYFPDTALAGGPVLQRCETGPIDYYWMGSEGSPDPARLPVDGFSARWTATLPFAGGTARFITFTDDGVRVFVNGRKVIDNWTDHPITMDTASVPLEAGQHVVRMEYFESGGEGLAQLVIEEDGAPPPSEQPQIQFLVIQGGVEGPNLTSYEVLQEQSAWLAGAAAALMTKTGVVGHISGIRVPPGLKGRAAYAAGVAYAKPGVKLLTTFCGEQDDAALAEKVTIAQADAGADIIFTMLNAGRTGAIAGCREKKIKQIGNVRDWVPVAPDVFIASAIADVSVAMSDGVMAALSGRLVPGQHVRLGVANGNAVRLAMATDVPESVRAAITAYTADIASGKIAVPTTYEGPEFSL